MRLALCVAVVLLGVKYCFEAKARFRADGHPEAWWSEVSPDRDETYTARLAFIGRTTILLRLYRTGDPTLLAERSYTEAGVALRWTDDGWLIYDTSDTSYEEGSIRLPPTRLDNLLAKLP
ncbi:hypothetical protein DBV14_32170 [Variovorax sp. KBW07]|uniref:hypothetical protein n=1 Tax=Variovorax sp. KBW07 TaxID=2153358 RepID=UPI000F577A8A|nr:hypothetical protein [Variovorax sp. KBW07]RQO37504.1 hypothetical protein DBV14_32170 [Variovorax sp. KBW07]